MKTFKEIYIEVLNQLRMEEGDMEANMQAQIKKSINDAYRIVSRKVKLINIDYLPVIQGKVELPRDIIGSIQFEPSLDHKTDRLSGDNLLTTRDDGEIFTLTYSAIPELLVEDIDIPNMPERLENLLVIYPCYNYYLAKKRLDLASQYKSEFDNELLTNGEPEQDSQNYIQDVYNFF